MPSTNWPLESPERRPQLQRNETVVTVGTADGILVSPQVKRRALLVGAPLPVDTPVVADTVLAHAVSTAATGSLLAYTVPAGVQAYLTSAAILDTDTTTAVLALILTRGATVCTFLQGKSPQQWTGRIPLIAGDVVNWQCTTLFAASTADMVIGIERERVPIRVTLSTNGPAVLEKGLTLSPGTLPLYLHEDWIGSAIKHEIHAIASQAGVLVPVLDIFDA